MKFSIITVCYNSASVLPRAIASLREQRGADFEWVVVDGGSTDGTTELVRGAGLPLGDFVSERDRGIYDAMNKGIARARGDVLFFLNSDDALFDPEVLADVARMFDANPALDFLYGSVVMVKPDRRTLKHYTHVNQLTLPYEDLCHQSVFARRRVFERVGNFSLQWKTSADYDWFIRVFRAGCKVQCTRRVIAWFTEGGAHRADPEGLRLERERLRLQYLSRPRLNAGILTSRVVHKLSKLARGYVVGESNYSGPAPRS